MNNSNRADEFGEVAAAVASQRKFAVYHELAARARRTGKAVIVRTGKVAGKPYVDRLYPVRHNPTAARRAARYQSTRNRAEEFLHRCVCTEEDWTFVSKLLAPIKRESVRKGKAAWGTNYLGGIPRTLHLRMQWTLLDASREAPRRAVRRPLRRGWAVARAGSHSTVEELYPGARMGPAKSPRSAVA